MRLRNLFIGAMALLTASISWAALEPNRLVGAGVDSAGKKEPVRAGGRDGLESNSQILAVSCSGGSRHTTRSHGICSLSVRPNAVQLSQLLASVRRSLARCQRFGFTANQRTLPSSTLVRSYSVG